MKRMASIIQKLGILFAMLFLFLNYDISVRASDVSSDFIITIPKSIVMQNTREADYEISVRGLRSGYTLSVSPTESFTMHETNYLKPDACAYVSQNDTLFTDVSGDDVTTYGKVSVAGVGAGTWTGVLTFTIKLDAENVFLEPGLYDAYDNLLCPWDTSGIQIDWNYTLDSCVTSSTSIAYVIQNFYPETVKAVLPERITMIGEYAFAGSSTLTSIVLPSGITMIGNGAFYGCASLSELQLPNVFLLGEKAFYGCTSLQSISLPSSLSMIGNEVFYGCLSLTAVNIPDSITMIGERAFTNCMSLKEISIPATVGSVGNGTFSGCSALTSIYYSGSSYGAPWGAENATIIR